MKILKIENKAAKVCLDDTVDSYSRKILMAEIAKVYGASAQAEGAYTGDLTNCAENAVDTLTIDINSPGGSVIEGFAICNEIQALRARGVHVTAVVNLAASMASVIAAACDVVQIHPTGRMMVHEVSVGCHGDAAKHASMAKLCDEMSNQIAELYAMRGKKTAAEFRTMMKSETWMNADECIDCGLANEKFAIRETSNTITDVNLINRLTNPSSEEAVAEIASLKSNISAMETDHAAAIAELTDKLTVAESALQDAATQAVEFEAVKAKLTEAEALTVTQATAIAAHADELKSAHESAAAKAVELAAAAGIETPANIEGAQEKPDHFAAMAKMTPAERTAYFRANQKAIKAQIKS